MTALDRAPARLAAFAALLGLAFGAAWQLGDAVDPLLDPASSPHEAGHSDDDH